MNDLNLFKIGINCNGLVEFIPHLLAIRQILFQEKFLFLIFFILVQDNFFKIWLKKEFFFSIYIL